jgi:hypothetical protein
LTLHPTLFPHYKLEIDTLINKSSTLNFGGVVWRALKTAHPDIVAGLGTPAVAGL